MGKVSCSATENTEDTERKDETLDCGRDARATSIPFPMYGGRLSVALRGRGVGAAVGAAVGVAAASAAAAALAEHADAGGRARFVGTVGVVRVVGDIGRRCDWRNGRHLLI